MGSSAHAEWAHPRRAKTLASTTGRQISSGADAEVGWALSHGTHGRGAGVRAVEKGPW